MHRLGAKLRRRARPRTARKRRPSRLPRWVVFASASVAVLAAAVATIAADAGGGSSQDAPTPTVGAVSQHHRFRGAHHAPFISVRSFKRLWNRRDPQVVLVDVRGARDRAQAHIPHDIWVPLADARTTGWRFLKHYRRKLIVLYCACPWAEAAQESVILESHGFSDRHLRVLHEGIPSWIQAGYPVVAGGDVCAHRYWPRACKHAYINARTLLRQRRGRSWP
jgi:rhodanese-related sulfurtransferase